jgi:general stress protein 26
MQVACREVDMSPEQEVSHAQELKQKFWNAFKENPVIMVGLAIESGVSRPMTAQFLGESASWWFFITKEGEFFQRFTEDHRAVATYCAKDPGLFAAVLGRLTLEADRNMIDRLWNRYVGAWFDGKDDPNLALLRFDATSGEIWLKETGLVAGVKLLLGADPKKEYADHVARVTM